MTPARRSTTDLERHPPHPASALDMPADDALAGATGARAT